MLPKHKPKQWGTRHALAADTPSMADIPKDDAAMERKRVYCSRRWRRLRNWILDRGPLCVACEAQGVVRAAQAIDHIVPLRDAPDRAFDESNLQPLCHACHNAKTMSEIVHRRRDNAKYPRSPITHPDTP